jgi:phage replication O-like protein O
LKLEQPVASYGSPQIEDGHTRIANELLEAIIRFDFSKRQYKIVFFVLRKTYGWNKKADVMSLSQILDGTGLRRDHAGAAIDELVSMNVLYPKQVQMNGQLLGLNKKYKEWKCTQNGDTVPKTGQRCTQNRVKGVPKTGTTKDTTKNNTKDIEGFDEFWAIWPNTDRKEGKKPCLEKWKAKKLSLIHEKIIAHVKAQKLTKKWREGFEPSPVTYINQERWNDTSAPQIKPWDGAK